MVFVFKLLGGVSFMMSDMGLKAWPTIAFFYFSIFGFISLSAKAEVVAIPPLKIDFPYPNSTIFFIKSTLLDDPSIELVLTSPGVIGAQSKVVDKFDGQGGNPPVIESVFLEDVNRDSTKELLILVKWNIEKFYVEYAWKYLSSSYLRWNFWKIKF